MNKKLSQIIDESIKLELNIAKIYKFFSDDTYPEDSDFWWKLGLEEEKHADLLASMRGTLLLLHQFPSEFLAPSVEMLYETNNKLISMFKGYNKKLCSRRMLFNIALEIEQLAGELHYQLAMETSPTSSIMKIFQEMNKCSKDHKNRIRTYMSEKGIEEMWEFVL